MSEKKKKIKKRRPRSKPGELPQILKTKHGSAYMNYMGRRYFLGTYGSEEAEQKRRQIVAEFDAALGVCPRRRSPITVEMLVLRFLNYAKRRYVKNGRSTLIYERAKYSCSPLLKLYARMPVDEFKPLALKAVRNVMIDSGTLCRNTINMRISLLVQMFRWGVENELVETETWMALDAVSGLYPGEENVRDTPPVEEVELFVVLRTLPLLSPAVGDMVRVQVLTGMRPGEIVRMRPVDIYRQGDRFPRGYKFFSRLDLKGCWVYIPEEHKTEHHNKVRFVILPIAAQRILAPYLKRQEHDDYVFSPAAEHEIRLATRQEERRKKGLPPSSDRKANPKRKPGKRYNPNSYRTSIQRAIERHNERLLLGEMKGRKAECFKRLTEIRKEMTEEFKRKPTAEELASRLGISLNTLIPQWFPNQLRHQFGTTVRENESLEAASVALGHSSVKTTEIYARKSAKEAIEVR